VCTLFSCSYRVLAFFRTRRVFAFFRACSAGETRCRRADTHPSPPGPSLGPRAAILDSPRLTPTHTLFVDLTRLTTSQTGPLHPATVGFRPVGRKVHNAPPAGGRLCSAPARYSDGESHTSYGDRGLRLSDLA
jgi:hypothetical protein